MALSSSTDPGVAGSLLSAQRDVLAMIAEGARLRLVLAALARSMEAHAGGEALVSILLADPDRGVLRHGAAPNLPAAYNDAIDGIAIGPDAGSCGTAAHRGEPVIARDIRTDPLWAGFRALAEEHRLRACWSTPIRSAAGEVLGTFAIYHREPHVPAAGEVEVVELMARCAAIAIERDRTGRLLARDRDTLAQMIEQAPMAVAVLHGPRHEFRHYNARYLDIVPSGRVERGRPVVECLPEAARLIPVLDRALAGETVSFSELEIPFADERSDGGSRYYDVVYSPLREGGAPVGVLAIATEVTEAVRVRAPLEDRLREERAVAEGLQRALLPEHLPPLPGIETAVHYAPAAAAAGVGVGGDWYDAVALDEDRVLLVIGDVGGGGLEAATAMSQMRAAARANAIRDPRPAEILTQVDRYCERLGLADLVTMAVGVLDRRSGVLAYAGAGHPPGLLIRPGQDAVLLPGDPQPPVGTGVARFAEHRVDVPIGSLVVFYTDGLVDERHRPIDETLEEVRRAAGSGPRSAGELAARLRARLPSGAQGSDDVAFMVCEAVEGYRSPETGRVAEALRLRRPAVPAVVPELRAAVLGFARGQGASPAMEGDIAIAVTEACSNSVIHAYVGLPAAGTVELRAWTAGGEMVVMVADEGRGMMPRTDSPGLGLGLSLMAKMANHLEVLDHAGRPGVAIRMHFQLR
jgi:anti-sigma regulatory factor (Ser/Thr protein kinase)